MSGGRLWSRDMEGPSILMWRRIERLPMTRLVVIIRANVE